MPRRSRTVLDMFVPALRHESPDLAPHIIFVHPLSSVRPFLSIHPLSSIRILILSLLLLGFAMVQATPAMAAKYAAIVIEEHSGKVLFARNADQARYPASLTKIMTLYLLFEELEARRLTMDTRMRVSKTAAGRSPSKLYLQPGQSVAVRDAIYALITKSANDVATVVAEHLSGTERDFGKRMTRKARALGMSRTNLSQCLRPAAQPAENNSARYGASRHRHPA